MIHVFPVKKSLKVKLITISILLIVIFTILSKAYRIINTETNGFELFLQLFIILLLLFIPILFYAQSPQKWLLTDNEIILKKGFGKIVIPKQDIKSIKKIPYTAIPFTTGTMGFFGYQGNTMDAYKLYVGDERNMFNLELKEGKIRGSCLQHTTFVELIHLDLQSNKSEKQDMIL